MTTSLFGQSKFGTFKFGATVQTRPRFGLEVDWANRSVFSGANEAPLLQKLSMERGRRYTISADGQSFQTEDTGRLSAVLFDENQRFDPYNVSSPLFGQIGGGKYFRVTVRTPADNYYALMAGMIDEPISFSESGIPKARLEGTDGWAYLRNQNSEVFVPLQEAIYADAAMLKVLESAGWPRIWGSDLEAGVDLRPYFWVESRSAAQVIHELAHSELGTVSMAGNGALKFRSRQSLEDEVHLLTDTDVRHDGIRRMTPAEVIRNVIKVASTPRSEQAVQTVWEIPGRWEVAAGETIDDVFAEFKYNDEPTPVKDPITPVITTDFTGTQNEDGSGSDLTSGISVSMYAYATRANISITNSGGTAAWVYVKVRGTPIAKASTVSFGYRDAASIKQFGPRPFTLSIDQNVNVARQYRDLLSSYLTLAKNFLVVDLVPNPEVQFAFDLGQIVRGRFDSFRIDQAYRVIRIRHEWDDEAGYLTNTQLYLEPYVRLFTGVQIPMQIPFQLGSVA